jgi:hypothetical protein
VRDHVVGGVQTKMIQYLNQKISPTKQGLSTQVFKWPSHEPFLFLYF